MSALLTSHLSKCTSSNFSCQKLLVQNVKFKLPANLLRSRSLHSHSILYRSTHRHELKTFSQTFINSHTRKFLKVEYLACSGISIRFNSNGTTLTDELSPDYIPPPPPIPEITDTSTSTGDVISSPDVGDIISAVGEPSFAELGLGGWGPVGIVQNCLEWLHISTGLPWWGTIAVATICVRVLLFPIVIKAQQNAAKMQNNMPQLQVMQDRMSEARQSGNTMEAAILANQIVAYMKEKDVNPLKNMIVPLAQAPVFISFFVGLRKMANFPLESMKVGGLFWFENLTIPDPYFLIPAMTSLTLLITLEIGAETGARLESMKTMRYVFRAMPFLFFPIMMKFPAAVLCYWLTSNLFTLCQVAVLRIPSVRSFFNIEKIIHLDPSKAPPKKGFIEGFKESYSNARISAEIKERKQRDLMRFKKAGSGPVVKTYATDPTKKTMPTKERVSAKNR
ncbi:PREDICTED: mitochondrial inner membrane protein OXA1L-like [Priapulus caudatus]|uniref:Mitochondrial inner membrane protein OXA1L-like n=1 Tax=Priapulus caudatus TaxID=37621 RepID=A0ABM1EG36_PRICU|nr:PREDICTED: mitochondrial inner membrane protein OXA1L-like [Priapulus caudatus]